MILEILFILILVNIIFFAPWYSNVRLPMIVAFLSHFFLGAAFYHFLGFMKDADLYNSAAIDLSSNWNFEAFADQITDGKRSTSLVTASIYSVFGIKPYLAMIVFSFIFAQTPYLTYQVCKNFQLRASASSAVWISSILPQLLFWSSLMGREGLVITCLILIFYILSRFSSDRNIISDGHWYLLLVILISQTRVQLLLCLSLGMLLVFLNGLLNHKDNFLTRLRNEKLNLLCLIVIHASSFYLVLANPTSYVLGSEGRGIAVDDLSSGQSTSALVSSNNNLLYHSFSDFLQSTFGPFAWSWKSPSMLIVGLDGFLFLLIAVCFILGFIKFNNLRFLILLSTGLAAPIFAGNAYLFSNYGLAMRLRDGLLVLFIVPITAIFSQHRAKKKFSHN